MPRGESVATTAAHVPSLLESKLIPPGAGELLVRPRLLSALDGRSSMKLTLLSAPAGFGKTSLLATWAAQASPEAVAWLTLDARDGDSLRFWSCAAEAVERVRPGAGGRAAGLLRSRGAAPERALNELLADLGPSAPLAIVLDDLHLVEDRECLGLLAYAIENLPPGVRLVVGTRADPSLPLARLRARGLLGEVRAADLAFTVGEARQLLVERDELDLGEAEVELLVERTEGWPAALYLAALWLRDLDDPRSHAHAFASGNRHVIEYLTDEILETLDPCTRDFLVQTSVLGTLSARLCDYVLERDDSGELLVELSRANLLLTFVDRGDEWFRYHALLGGMLRLQLERRHPRLAFELHRRAAEWFREHDLPEDAVEHAFSGGKPEDAAAILSEAWLSLLRDGDAAVLLRLVERLPTDVILGYPELAAGSALATYLARRPAHERSRWLTVTERSRTESPHTWTLHAARSASLARATAVDGDVGAAALHARQALEISAKLDDLEGEVPSLAALAYALYLAGAPDEAWAHASAAVVSPEAPDRPHGVLRALGLLALLAADAGRMGEAEAKAREAVKFSRDRALSTAASMHIAHLARARVLEAKGRLREAEAAADLGERLARMPDPSVAHAFASLVLAEVRTRRGRLASAADALADAAREIETFADPGRLRRELARIERLHRAAKKKSSTPSEPLSAAELAVLRLLTTDLSQRGIGRRLFLSVNTIKTHTRSIYRKLGVTTRAEAIARAAALGFDDDVDSPG